MWWLIFIWFSSSHSIYIQSYTQTYFHISCSNRFTWSIHSEKAPISLAHHNSTIKTFNALGSAIVFNNSNIILVSNCSQIVYIHMICIHDCRHLCLIVNAIEFLPQSSQTFSCSTICESAIPTVHVVNLPSNLLQWCWKVILNCQHIHVYILFNHFYFTE